MTVYDGPPGKPALTHVRTLAFDGKLSASLVRIETGRLDSFCTSDFFELSACYFIIASLNPDIV
jgi:hypothetical protein